MSKYKLILTLSIAAIAIFSFSTYSLVSQQTPIVSNLDLNCGFTTDFETFLAKNNYTSWNFERLDLKCAAFGGKNSSTQKIVKTPIVFIHGNSDVGFGKGTTDGYTSWQTGFRELATYFGSQGYKKAELYTTTWGPANPSLASQNNHAKKYVLQVRAFVEAVLAYTKAPQIDIIGHSMGVTIGRRICQGGQAQDQNEGVYKVGDSLKDKVRNFIGLAGANLGLSSCTGAGMIPTCSEIDGFNPGLLPSSGPSKFMASLNSKPGAQALNIYTIWSNYDDLITPQCTVWGKVTCRIPGQKGEVVKNSSEWTHFAVRDKTGPDILKWLQ